MTPTNDAEKAFEYIVEAFLMNDYKSVWEKEVETIRTALAKSAKVDVCSDCGSPMMDVCSGLEKISREGCNPETKTKVDGLLEKIHAGWFLVPPEPTDEMIRAYMFERTKGQYPHEDAGGGVSRKIKALFGKRQLEPQRTYHQMIDALQQSSAKDKSK